MATSINKAAIKSGFALWQMSRLLSESENELWLAEHIDLFFVPMRLGSTFIFSVILSETAFLGVDERTFEGGTEIAIRSEHHGVPIYSLLRKPIESIVFTDSSMYNMTASGCMTRYNLQNVLEFLQNILKRASRNAHESLLRDALKAKDFDGMTFFEYIRSLSE
jgi:hypothetical protein